jgi:hypothetical protein
MTLMAMRLGHVLGWTANLIALAFFGIFSVAALADTGPQSPAERFWMIVFFAVIAGIIWLIGRGLRYVLAGR